jgi:hypothetical protein
LFQTPTGMPGLRKFPLFRICGPVRWHRRDNVEIQLWMEACLLSLAKKSKSAAANCSYI